tara:strand:- start:156 stop:707 length:552 start_codon:yes stop_codon:yes gene_type:complete
MIYVKDNFLKPQLFKALVDYADDFTEVKTPGKSFWIKELPAEFENLLVNELKAIERKPIHIIKAFIRKAEGNQDSEWRIHNDTIIEGQQPSRAVVLYIESNYNELNGTAFWEHENYGETYIESNAEEFNRMLLEDANDKSKWKLKSVIGYKPNRLLSYPCNYFHSKYPNKFKEPRKVLVIFYK